MLEETFLIQGLVNLFSVSGEAEEIRESLLSLGLLIIGAKLAEGIFRRLRLNAIVAYAAVGILLGPVLGVLGVWHIEATGHIDLLLTLGVFIFFFLIGLDEIDISSFISSIKGRYFLAAVLSVAISMGVSLLVTSDLAVDFGLGLSFAHALALAGVLSMTSLGIVAKVLADDGRLRDPIGLQIFTVVVIAELITLLIVGFSIGEQSHDLSATGVLILLGKVAGFAVVSWVLSAKVLPPLVALLQRLIQVPQLSFGLLLGFLFLIVDGAEVMGLHGSLGALLFGASLSGLPYQVRREIMPSLRGAAEGFFVPLFFASAGLYFSFSFVSVSPWTMVALAFLPLLGNFFGAFLGAYVSRLTVPYAVASGLMGKGVAEIALLLVLRELGAINESVFSFLVLVMFCYILFMPPVISFTVNRASRTPSGAAQAPGAIPVGIDHFALDHIVVNDILDRSRRHPNPAVSVRDFTDRWINPTQHDYPVVERGALMGMVSLANLRYVPAISWEETKLGDIMRKETPHTTPDQPVEDALQLMAEHSLSALPVLEAKTDKFLGAVTRQGILDLMVMEGAKDIH